MCDAADELFGKFLDAAFVSGDAAGSDNRTVGLTPKAGASPHRTQNIRDCKKLQIVEYRSPVAIASTDFGVVYQTGGKGAEDLHAP